MILITLFQNDYHLSLWIVLMIANLFMNLVYEFIIVVQENPFYFELLNLFMACMVTSLVTYPLSCFELDKFITNCCISSKIPFVVDSWFKSAHR